MRVTSSFESQKNQFFDTPLRLTRYWRGFAMPSSTRGIVLVLGIWRNEDFISRRQLAPRKLRRLVLHYLQYGRDVIEL